MSGTVKMITKNPEFVSFEEKEVTKHTVQLDFQIGWQ